LARALILQVEAATSPTSKYSSLFFEPVFRADLFENGRGRLLAWMAIELAK
jgi:hypothetical protein